MSQRIQYLGAFDEPEPIERWTGTSSGGGGGASGEWVVARPAHETMKFRDALRAIASAGESGLSRYLEYFPLEAFRSPSLLADLAPPAAAAAKAAADEAEARSWARTGGGAGSSFGDGDASAAPPLRGRGNEEAGSLPLASWLLPRKQLLWLGPENTVGATHHDAFENLMLLVRGSKTFHLSPPQDEEEIARHNRITTQVNRACAPHLPPLSPAQDGGPHLRAHRPMREARLALVPAQQPGGGGEGAGEGAGAGEGRPRLVRLASNIGEPSLSHSYAEARLSRPAAEQPRGVTLGEATVFTCTAREGEVVYVPSYWWHEVVSSGGDLGGPIGINWFFEPFYLRLRPNASLERNTHYLLLDDMTARRLEEPFPPRAATPAADSPTHEVVPPRDTAEPSDADYVLLPAGLASPGFFVRNASAHPWVEQGRNSLASPVLELLDETMAAAETTTLVNAGASVGAIALYAASLGATVHVAEADPDSFEALLANVAANPEEVRRRITPSFVAVGDRPGAVRLSTPAGEAGGGRGSAASENESARPAGEGLGVEAGRSWEVAGVAFDAYLDAALEEGRAEGRTDALVVMDLDGGERAALRSAFGSLAHRPAPRPPLLVEAHPGLFSPRGGPTSERAQYVAAVCRTLALYRHLFFLGREQAPTCAPATTTRARCRHRALLYRFSSVHELARFLASTSEAALWVFASDDAPSAVRQRPMPRGDAVGAANARGEGSES